jgi:hypothetical protein
MVITPPANHVLYYLTRHKFAQGEFHAVPDCSPGMFKVAIINGIYCVSPSPLLPDGMSIQYKLDAVSEQEAIKLIIQVASGIMPGISKSTYQLIDANVKKGIDEFFAGWLFLFDHDKRRGLHHAE